MTRNRESIYINIPNRPYHIRRKIRNSRGYLGFVLGTAHIYGERRVVKKYSNRKFWHIATATLDYATKNALVEYHSHCTSEGEAAAQRIRDKLELCGDMREVSN
jgi:hypothetical protein